MPCAGETIMPTTQSFWEPHFQKDGFKLQKRGKMIRKQVAAFGDMASSAEELCWAQGRNCVGDNIGCRAQPCLVDSLSASLSGLLLSLLCARPSHAGNLGTHAWISPQGGGGGADTQTDMTLECKCNDKGADGALQDPSDWDEGEGSASADTGTQGGMEWEARPYSSGSGPLQPKPGAGGSESLGEGGRTGGGRAWTQCKGFTLDFMGHSLTCAY